MNDLNKSSYSSTRISRRAFLTAASSVVGATALVGCVATQPATAPTGTAAETTNAESNVPLQTVTDGKGRSVELPVDPQRVLAGYTTDIDIALILELPLVGAPGARGLGTQAFARYQPVEKLANVARITTFPEANLEEMLALDPDLIIDSVGDYIEGRYDNFSQIAPTLDISTEYSEGWRTYLRTVAQIFDRTTLAEAYIADYEARAAEIGARLTARWPAATFALIGAFEPGIVWVSDTTMHPVKVLVEDVGMTPAAIMPATVADRPRLSMEQLPMLNEVEILFLRVEPLAEGEGRDQSVHGPLKASPIWQQLGAVQNGLVVEYDAELFYASPLTASAFLDVVEQTLLA